MNRGLHDRKAGKAESAALQETRRRTSCSGTSRSMWRTRTRVTQRRTRRRRLPRTPANVSYVKLFKALDMDVDGQVTRDEWALTLRRTVGVGSRVTDDDLEALFDAINTDKTAASASGSSPPSREARRPAPVPVGSATRAKNAGAIRSAEPTDRVPGPEGGGAV